MPHQIKSQMATSLNILPFLYVLRDIYNDKHWNAATYADHLLFNEQYKSVVEDIDHSAEAIIGMTENGLDMTARERAEATTELFATFDRTGALKNVNFVEFALQKHIREVVRPFVRHLPPPVQDSWRNHWDNVSLRSSQRVYLNTMAHRSA